MKIVYSIERMYRLITVTHLEWLIMKQIHKCAMPQGTMMDCEYRII